MVYGFRFSDYSNKWREVLFRVKSEIFRSYPVFEENYERFLSNSSFRGQWYTDTF